MCGEIVYFAFQLDRELWSSTAEITSWEKEEGWVGQEKIKTHITQAKEDQTWISWKSRKSIIRRGIVRIIVGGCLEYKK